MAEVLLISKPVEPPWNDSSKNLVRDLATSLTRHHPTVLTRRGSAPPLDGAAMRPIYGPRAGAFAPALRDNARVLSTLLVGRKPSLWHFFFAPNVRTSRVGAFASRLRSVPTVHTVCSAPRDDVALDRVLFADRTVVLSRHTERRFLEGGVSADRLRRIPPAIPPLEPRSDAARRTARRDLGLPESAPLVLFPGDLEFGGGARLCLEALPRLRPEVVLVLACRAKTPRAREVDAKLRSEIDHAGLAGRVRFLGETPRIHDLLAASDVVALPSETLYAKMDYPLVLLEAMSLERPVIVATGTPAEELAEGDAAVAIAPTAEALAHEVGRLLDDPAGAAAIGARARARVLDRYAPPALGRAYDALYDELLGAIPEHG